MSSSSSFVLLSETDQQIYLHASMCHNVQKSIENAIINGKSCFDRFLSVLTRDDILLNDFHDANGAFRCSL